MDLIKITLESVDSHSLKSNAYKFGESMVSKESDNFLGESWNK